MLNLAKHNFFGRAGRLLLLAAALLLPMAALADSVALTGPTLSSSSTYGSTAAASFTLAATKTENGNSPNISNASITATWNSATGGIFAITNSSPNWGPNGSGASPAPVLTVTPSSAAAPGVYAYTVSLSPNQGSAVTMTGTLTINNAAPTLTSISPTEKIAGDAQFTMTLNGSGFSPTSVARFNGSNRATTFVSGVQLTATITAADISAAGTFPITVVNPAPGGGTSGAVNLLVKKTTSTTLTSNNNPSSLGQNVKFTANVSGSGGNPSGTVTFMDGSVTIGTDTVGPSGMASFQLNSLTAGTHSISAVYSGDSVFGTSNSPTVLQIVNSSVATTTALSSSPSPSTYGQQVTLTATLSPNTATGTVQFSIDGAAVGSPVTVVAGTATFTTTSTQLSAGIHMTGASFTGTGTYQNSTATAGSHTVNKANQTITFGALPNKTYGDASYAFTQATGGASGNAITYTSTGPITLSGNTITINGQGAASVTAHQAGNGNFNAAADVTQNFTIAKKDLTVTVDSKSRVYNTPNPTFTGSLTGAVAGDALTLSFSTTATQTSPVLAGGYPITATINANPALGNYNVPSPMPQGTLTITKASQAITFNQGNVSFGALPVNLTATGGASTSPITFSKVSGLGSVSISAAGQVTGPSSSATNQTIKARASQAGDTNYSAAADVDIDFDLLENVAPTSVFSVVSGTAGTNGWYRSNVTAHIVAADAGSGVAQIKYSIDGGTEVVVNAGTTPDFAITGEGSHTISFKAIDANGNESASSSATVKIDTIGPVLNRTPARSADHNGWYNHDVVVSLGATDVTSGFSGSIPDQVLTGTASENKDLTASATDEAGNTTTSTFTFKFDATDPVIGVLGVGNNDKLQEVTITSASVSDLLPIDPVIKLSDPAGIGVFYDPIANPGKFNLQALPWSATVDGNYTLFITATDAAGNTSTLVWHFTRDHTKPAITLGAPLSDLSPFYNVNPFNIFYTLSDNLDTSPKFTLQRLLGNVLSADGQQFMYSTASETTAGTYTLEEGLFNLDLSAIDAASNSASINRLFLLDLTPSVTSHSFLAGAPNADGWSKANVQVLLNAVDPAVRVASGALSAINGSGVKRVDFGVGSPTTTGTGAAETAALNIEGTFDLRYRSFDNAGNTEAEKSLIVKIDKTKPSISGASDITMTGTGPGTAVTYTPSAADAGSGVKSLTVSPESGYAFPVGTTTVTVTAIDNADNACVKTFTVTIEKETPIITFPAVDNQTYGVSALDLNVSATHSSGLTLVYTVEDPSVAEWTGSSLKILKSGHVKVTVSLEGDEWRNDATSVVREFDVAKKELTVTADDATKVYGQSDPAFTVQYSGFAAGDDKDSLGGSLSFSRAVGENVTEYAITPSGYSSDKYSFTYVNGKLTITPAPLTVKANSQEAVYGDALAAFSASFTGLVNGDEPSDIGSAMLTSAGHQGSDVGTYDIVVTENLSSPNYTITYTPGTLTITKRSVTVVPDDKNKAYGAALPTLTYTLSNQYAADGLDTPPTLSTTATQSSNVTTYPITASGGSDDNYSISYATGTLSVTKADLLVKADDKTITFGDAEPTLTATVTTLVNGDTNASIGLSVDRAAGTNAGTYMITAHASSDNYNITFETGTLTIEKAVAHVVVNGYTGVYDGAEHGATGSATGVGDANLATMLNLGESFTNVPGGTAHWTFSGNPNYTDQSGDVAIIISKASATISVSPYSVTYDTLDHTATGTAKGVNDEDLSALLDLSNTTHTDAGTYSDGWSFAGNGNYKAASGTVGDKIDKADANITVTPYGVTYDGDAHTATGTATGVGGLDLSSLLNLSGTTHTNAGTYASDAWSFAGNANYNPASGTVSDSISKADADISVTPYSVTYDGTAHTATATAKGVKGEDLSSLLNLSGTTHTNAGAYSNDPWSFAGDVNYNAKTGTVSDNIDKADATIAVTPYSVTYDSVAQTATGTATGVNGEDLSSLLNLSGTTHTNAGTYGTDAWTFPGNLNYNAKNGTVCDKIAKAPASVTPAAASKTYGGPDPTLTGTLNGFIAADGVTATYTRVAGESVAGGPYTISATLAPVGVLGNYDITYNTAAFTINKKVISVTADPKTKVYGQLDPALTYTSGPLVVGDSFTGSLSRAPGQDVGGYAITQGTLALSSNYTLLFTGSTLTITKATLTIKANDSGKNLNGVDPTLTATTTGYVNGDLPGVVSGLVITRAPGEGIGTYAIVPSGATALNYNIVYVNGTFTIKYASNSGFLQPVNTDGSSVFKGGSTIPLKIRIYDANGVSVGDAGTIIAKQLNKLTSQVVDSVNETIVSTTPNDDFRWDATDKQWIFNLSTKGMTVGKYRFSITLKDGTIVYCDFSLK